MLFLHDGLPKCSMTNMVVELFVEINWKLEFKEINLL